MASNENEYEISANPNRYLAAMTKIADETRNTARSIQASMSSIDSHLGQVSNTLSTITGMFGKMTAIIAGGAAFKEVIGKSVEWIGESKTLANQLGITTERASVMMVAMRHLGMDSEQVTRGAVNMTKQMVSNGAAFEKLGIKLKDANLQYRPTTELMAEVNDKLREIKNPIEQNIAGMKVYGEAWNEVRGVLKLSSEELKAAEQKAKDLGLVVGDEGVANAKAYKQSLNDMKLVITSLEVQTGNALLPTLVKMGSWMSGVAPVAGKAMGMVLESLAEIIKSVAEVFSELWQLISQGFSEIGDLVAEVMGGKAPDGFEFFRNCLKVVEIAFLAFKVLCQEVIAAVVGYIELLVANAMRMANTAEKALSGDFSGARQAWATGTANIEDLQKKHWEKMKGIASAGKEKLDEIISRGAAKAPEVKDKKIEGGPTYGFDNDKDKEKSRFQEWDAKLAADKDGYAKEHAMSGTAMEYSLSMERNYWKRILDTVSMSKEEKAQVERKYYTIMAAIRKEDFENDIAGEKLKLESFKNNHLERLEIANRIYQQNIDRFGMESKEAQAALGEVMKVQAAYKDQVLATNKVIAESRRNAELASIDAAEQDAEQQLAMRQLTVGQMLELDRQFEAKRYQIRMQALLEQEAMMRGPDEDPVALAQLHAQVEAVEEQHQRRLTQIKRKSEQQQTAGTRAMYGTMQQGFASVISNTVKGTMTMSQALQGAFTAVAGSLIDMAAQTAAEWLMNMLLADSASKVSAVGQISANAGVAGAAATASAAAIPFYGWAMAPEAGLAASAAAMAFMPMASAAGGYDIPAGINPIVQTHAQEMILPAKYANVIRDMAGQSDSGAGGGQTINYHDYSGKLSPAEIRRNVKVIADALKDHAKK